MSPTTIDFLENAFGANVTEIERLIRSNPDVLLRQREGVLRLLEDAWLGTNLAEQRHHELEGELWPVLPRSAPDVLELARTTFFDAAKYGTALRSARASRQEMQSLLLYAHGVHMPNPLRVVCDSGAQAGRDFLRAVSELCGLAPLITAEVVRIHDPTPPSSSELSPEGRASIEELAEHIGLALMSYEGQRQMNQRLRQAAAMILIERALEHLLDIAARDDAHAGTLLLPTAYDGPTIDALVRTLGHEIPGSGKGRQPSVHEVRLNQLIQLALPGLARVDLHQMVSIRNDDSFGVFRTDVSAALRETDDDIRAGRIAVAQRTVAEHMDSGVARLNAGTRRGALADATVGGAIGWGLGAALTASVSGLRDLLLAVLGGLAGDVSRNWPSVGERALRSHYVELGTASLRKRRDESIDLMAFSTDALWGPSLGADRQSASHRSIVSAILEDFPEEDGAE